MIPSIATILIADLDEIESVGNIRIKYDIYSVIIGIIGSVLMVVIPFIFFLSLLVWDNYTGLDMRRPINPEIHENWNKVSSAISNLNSRKDPTSKRMKLLFKKRGGKNF